MNNRLALGTVQFGLEYGVANVAGRVSFDEAKKILAYAANTGINTLDTAIAYGDSESTLGRMGVSEWRVVTKLPRVPDACENVVEWVDCHITGSLERLRVSRLHAVLLHQPSQLLETQGKELFAALERIKRLGYAEKIGVSIYAPQELDALFDQMHFDLVQAPLNILDRRLIDSGWAVRLKQLGVELHVRSAFLQGLLLLSPETRPSKFNRWSSLWSEWERWLNEHKLSPLQACLRYALNNEEVDNVVVGVDSFAQLCEIQAAVSGALPDLPNWPQVMDPDLINPARWPQL